MALSVFSNFYICQLFFSVHWVFVRKSESYNRGQPKKTQIVVLISLGTLLTYWKSKSRTKEFSRLPPPPSKTRISDGAFEKKSWGNKRLQRWNSSKVELIKGRSCRWIARPRSWLKKRPNFFWPLMKPWIDFSWKSLGIIFCRYKSSEL